MPTHLSTKVYLKLGYRPYTYQRKVFDALLEGRGFIVVKAPTGAGKTLAVFTPYMYQYLYDEFGIAPRYIHALPTQALVKAVEAKLREYLSKAGLADKLRVESEYGGGILASSLRYGLASAVNVVTVDTFVYYLTQVVKVGRHLNFPCGNIALSLTVFDEVHMLQDEMYYTPRILSKVLEFLRRARVPHVVMTATMPDTLAKALGIDAPDYYEIVCRKGEVKRGVVEVEEVLNAKLKSVDNIPKEAIEGVRDGCKLLIVVNTVGKAIKLYRDLKKRFGDDVILIHSRLRTGERRVREAKLVEGKWKVAVATQVIEAGLDLEGVRFLVTEVAPVDALIQRLGRCARRYGEVGKAWIFNVSSPAPYPDNLIEKTIKLLKSRSYEISEALVDVETCTSLVNEVYTEDIVNTLCEKLEVARELHKALKYLDMLSPFAYPPNIEFRLRYGTYVEALYPSKEVKVKLEDGKETTLYDIAVKCFEQHKVVKSIVEDFSLLEENIVKLSALNVELLEHALSISKIVVEVSVHRAVKRAVEESSEVDYFAKLELHPRRYGDSIKRVITPGRIYLLNPSSYSEGEGICR